MQGMRNKSVLIWSAVAALVLAALILSYSKIGTGNRQGAGALPTASAVPFTPIAHGERANVDKRVNYRITSAEQLDELWKTLHATGTPPAIDFKTHEVLAVFAGPDSGAEITVSSIEDTNQRTVSITLANPAGSCHAGTSRYEMVTVPTTTLPLTHKDAVVTTDNCP